MNTDIEIKVSMNDEVLRYIENRLNEIRDEFNPVFAEIREKDAKIAVMEQKIDLLTGNLLNAIALHNCEVMTYRLGKTDFLGNGKPVSNEKLYKDVISNIREALRGGEND